MQFNKQDVIAVMKLTGMIPVYYNNDIDVAKEIVKACYAGGVRVFEFTNRGAFAHEVFAQLMRFCASECPDLILGVGSVIDAPTAALFIQLGANFVVGPLFNQEVARLCNRRGVLYIPGCGSATEVGNAQEAGCDVCKVFPGDVLTPRFVKGILAPMPWSQLMITGGVEPNEENLRGWFDAGAICVGMGSKLFATVDTATIYSVITERCRRSLEIIREIRNK